MCLKPGSRVFTQALTARTGLAADTWSYVPAGNSIG